MILDKNPYIPCNSIWIFQLPSNSKFPLPSNQITVTVTTLSTPPPQARHLFPITRFCITLETGSLFVLPTFFKKQRNDLPRANTTRSRFRSGPRDKPQNNKQPHTFTHKSLTINVAAGTWGFPGFSIEIELVLSLPLSLSLLTHDRGWSFRGY